MRYRGRSERVIVALLGAVVALILLPFPNYMEGVGVRDAWATHCTLSAAAGNGVVTTLAQLTSQPNNELSCNTANSRSDGATAFPGFSPFELFKAASGSGQGFTTTGTNPTGGGTTTLFSVTLASFINLNPGDITGNMFGRITLFSTSFNKAANIGPFATDAGLQSILIPCGSNTGDGVASGGAAGECPNSSDVANTSGTFGVNPAMTITSFGGVGAVASFQQQMNNIAANFGATGDNTEGFVFASPTARLFDFGAGAAVACSSGGTLKSTCARQGFTQFVGGALQSTAEAGNDAAGTTGSRVTIEAAFAVGTLASGLQAQKDFRVAFHQLISQGDFQMNTLGSFRANSPAFMPAASYPTGLSLSSSLNFLISQVAVPSTATGVIFLTRTPGTGTGLPGTALNSTYSQTLSLSNCLPGFLSSSEVPQAVLSNAFGGVFLFRGAFNDFACPAPP